MPDPFLSRESFGGEATPPDVVSFIASAIIEGSPFAQTLTPRPSRGNAVFPVIEAVSGQTWVAEGADIPDIDIDTSPEIVAVAKLAGIAALTRELLQDAELDAAAETRRIVQDAFSRDLDLGLLEGDGTPPNPQGVLDRAADVSGPTLPQAIAAAVAELGEAGGAPTHVALSPTDAAVEGSRTDDQGRPLYPGNQFTFGELKAVLVPAMPQPLVYDASRTYLVAARDFDVRFSEDYAPAFKTDKLAMRITGRFGAGVPVPAKTLRKITVTPPE